MPMTIRDLKQGKKPVTRNVASLVGGFVIAFGCFVLWILVASQIAGGTPSVTVVALGAVLSFAIGIYIRLADL